MKAIHELDDDGVALPSMCATTRCGMHVVVVVEEGQRYLKRDLNGTRIRLPRQRTSSDNNGRPLSGAILIDIETATCARCNWSKVMKASRLTAMKARA